MYPDGSQLPPSWGSWLALLLWLSLFWCLLGAAYPAHGQTQSERLASIERELTASLVTCGKLSDVLTRQTLQIETFKSELQGLKESLPIYEQKINDLENELKASRELSQESQAEVLRLRDLLRTSQERLAALSGTFDSYKRAREAVEAGLEREVCAWKVGTVVAALAAVAAVVFAFVK